MNQEKKETEIIVVGTSKAAFLLGISDSRVRFLLKSDRIVGARKEGRIWIIPLKNGMPQITKITTTELKPSNLLDGWRGR